MRNIFLYNNKKGYNFEIPEEKTKVNYNIENKKVNSDLTENKRYIERVFSLSCNGDIVKREFVITTGDKTTSAMLMYAEGLSNVMSINDFILKPLMLLKTRDEKNGKGLMELIENTMLPQAPVSISEDLKDIVLKVNIGNALLLVDGIEKGFSIDVKSWEHRGVGNPENESVIQGPHEGFNEVLRCNTALIRKTLNTPNLIMENIVIGKTSQTPAALAYVKNVTNSALVDEVRKRITNIDAEYIMSSLDVEQYIEEASFLTIPQMITTERPDRVCKALSEGRVAVILNGSSHVLVMPATFFDLTTSAEDEYLRYPYSVFVRFLRYMAVGISLLFPAVFIAVLNYHPELILTNLMFAISSSRAFVPFSAVIELLLMELSFELIKEAGIRVPGPIGSTLGIVGGLIIGQAAVNANVVSPIMIIIVAVTGISAFTVPSYSLSFAFRFSRFLYIFGAAAAGLVGVVSVFFVNTLAAFATKSFGVPFMSPLAPSSGESTLKLMFGSPIWKRGSRRENYLSPKDDYKKGRISRKWLKEKE